jgi:hypothetical protein
MPINNTPIYDSVLAGIAASNGAWLEGTDPAKFDAERDAAVVIAGLVDAQIPTVVNGVTISQRDLMAAIMKGVMVGRSPVSTNPTSYNTLADSIATLFTLFSSELKSNTTGGSAPITADEVSWMLGVTPTLGEAFLYAPINLSSYLTPGSADPVVMAANVAGLKAALQLAASQGGGRVIAPNNIYHFNAAIDFHLWNKITLEGQGNDATTFMVHDLNGGYFLDCYNPGFEIQHCRLMNFTIIGAGPLVGATAVRQMNWTRGAIAIRIFGWVGTKSVGINCAGRELVYMRNEINADIDYLITKNLEFPASQLGLDHYVFDRNALWSMDVVEPCIKNVGAIDITTTAFVGTTALISDGGGIKLTGMHDVVGLNIQNVRHESALIGAMTGWGIEISGTHSLRSVTLINCEGKSNFIKIRNVINLSVIACKYEESALSPGVALDVDESCESVVWQNLASVNGNVTIGALNYTMASEIINFGSGFNAPAFAVLSNKTLMHSLLGRRSNTVYTGAKRLNLLKTQTVKLGPANNAASAGTMTFAGIEIGGVTTVYAVTQLSVYGAIAISASFQTSNFAESDTPGKLSVYTDGADGQITVKNNLAIDLDLTITWN